MYRIDLFDLQCQASFPMMQKGLRPVITGADG